MQALYGLLFRFLQVVVSIFFRTVEVVGTEHIPREGAVVFVGNHPNSLLDPILITVTCGRKLHFLVKDTLFKMPHLRLILSTLGAVPVKRRQDHADGQIDNSGPFDALFALLNEGAACGVFPEGISHAESELAPFKTGAARIAFGAAAKSAADGGQPVRIVPCGLCYYQRTRMRSQVLVQYGPPIEIDPGRLETWQADERPTVRALTADIEAALRALTINAPDFETLRVLDGVRRLYTTRAELPLAQHAELTRRFMSHYETHGDDPEVQGLYREVQRFVADLDDLGLTERELSEPVSVMRRAARVLRHLILLFVLAPLTLPGVIVHTPVLAMAILAGEGLTQRKDVIATTKVMVATLAIVATYGLIAAALFFGLDPPWGAYAAGATGVLLPLSGLATVRVFRRQAAIRRGLWVLLNLFALPREVERLRAQRAELTTRVWDMVDRLAPSTIERILPPEAEPTA